ncbi:hypothetical protein N0V84_006942 [Fusarium piperis]|uniref:Uncharacterized protein n=1 Tax=Fusarium piperis TaxID=1435070 RepID=A0A9W8WAW8_9HYPO|nr:hypothetical protein N0V84_006942 [Fusarium piperis]
MMPKTVPNKGRGSKSGSTRYEMRREDFYRLCKIEKKLDRFFNITQFDNDLLEKFSIVRGSPFNIDDDDPADLDRRFFLRGPIEDMEHGLKVIDEAEFTDHCRWPRFEPIDEGRRREEDQEYADERRYARKDLHYGWRENDSGEASEIAFFCEQAAKVALNWQCHLHIHKFRRQPNAFKIWFSKRDGQPRWDFWESGEFYMWHSDADREFRHLSVPQVRTPGRGLCPQASAYIDHCIWPVLVIGFHGQFTARITQAYFEDGKVVIRPSRLIDMNTPVVSPEARLVIRWLNCVPVGDTRFSTPEEKPNRGLFSIRKIKRVVLALPWFSHARRK